MSERKGTGLFCRGKKRRHNDKAGNCNFYDLKRNFEYNINCKNSLEALSNIFTVELGENDPLWRVRAYFLGFLFADGSIFRLKNPIQYMVYAAQNEQDKDIIENLQKAIGGNITGPNKVGRIRLEFTSKALYFKLKELGMVEKHNLKEGALKVKVPSIVNKKISCISLLRDFVRGLLDGDGCFSGCYENYSLRYQLLGPKQFIIALNEKILEEIADISSFITPAYLKVFLKDNNEYVLYGKNQIYIKGRGFYEITSKDLETGKIVKREHQWLTRLHFAGAINSIRFFNWLYSEDDNFDKLEINGIRLCGSRKFQKALLALGNKTKRKEKLAPEWRDIIYKVIPVLSDKYYQSQELLELVNNTLKKTLSNLEIVHIFNEKKIINLDPFVYRLKFIEYIDNLIGHFRKKEGNVYKNYYYNKLNPPKTVQNNIIHHIDLKKLNGEIIRNIKNVIISLFIANSKVKKFQTIIEELLETGIFSKGSILKSRIKLYLMELVAFEILLRTDDLEEIEDNKFLLNLKTLEEIFKLDLKVIKYKYIKFLNSLTNT
ncbi:MAG: hypothetical protein ACXADU_13225 [Promethearchaeota archaeon]|jgi:hypothetical protein